MRALRAGRPGMDVPVSLALGGAYMASIYNSMRGSGEVYFDSVTMFIFFLSVARHVQLVQRQRNASAGAALARLLPELGSPAAGVESEVGRGRLFEAVARLLEHAAVERPLVVVLEDLHWADASTRELVSFLVRTLHDAPVLLAVTYRVDEMHRRHPLRPLLAELERHARVSTLSVGRLDAAQVEVLLESFVRLRSRVPEAHLLVVGDGPDRIALGVQADTTGGAVRLLGVRDDVPALLAAADLCVVPSLGHEGSSAALKEPLAARRPLVASDLAGVRERTVEWGDDPDLDAPVG